MNKVSGWVVFAAVGCASPQEAVQLDPWPDGVDALAAACDSETEPALTLLCEQELAVRLAQSGDHVAARDRCGGLADDPWRSECHFLVAEQQAAEGAIDHAWTSCLAAHTFVVNCVEHVAALQQPSPRRPRPTATQVRRAADDAVRTAAQHLARLPDHHRAQLLPWVRLGRVRAELLGQGRPPAGLGTDATEAGATERTVLAQEVVRGMGPDAPWSTIVAAWQGAGTWDATEAPIVGCIPLAEPVDAATGPRTPVWGNAWRRLGADVAEDSDIALMTARFWAGSTQVKHLHDVVRRDRRSAVAWTAVHLARHLVGVVESDQLQVVLSDAARHPDPVVQALARRPLPASQPPPRACVGPVPGQDS